jgi:predicted RecA/RadA family phage recombinase
MATNLVYKDVDNLPFYTNASLESGDPFVVGQIPAVAMGDEDAEGYTVGRLVGVFKLEVKAIDGTGNSAVVIGDKLYYVSGDTPKLNKKNTGVFFGYAYEAINAGATATIKVLLK